MSIPESQEHGIHIENMYLRFQLYLDHTAPETTQAHTWGRFTLHTHPFAEVFFCKSGFIEIKTANERLTLLPGDIAILPADVEHVKLPVTPQTRWNSVFFSYFKRQTRGSRDIFSVFHRALAKREPIVARQRHDLSSRLFRMIEGAAKTVPRFAALHLADILFQILDGNGDSTHSASKEALPSRGDVDIDSIARLEALVSEHYMEDISTESASKQFHISARQLDRIAHRRYGVTFRQAVINRRLQVAIEMFSATRMTVEEIGLAVGFSSRLSFSRAFRAQYGISPQEYRKNHGMGD